MFVCHVSGNGIEHDRIQDSKKIFGCIIGNDIGVEFCIQMNDEGEEEIILDRVEGMRVDYRKERIARITKSDTFSGDRPSPLIFDEMEATVQPDRHFSWLIERVRKENE